MPAPNVATINQSSIIKWSDGTLFDGWALFVLSLPLTYSAATLANQNPPQVIGQRFRADIINGVPDGSVRVYYTTSIDPPGCQYAVWWYDTTDKQIYAPSLASELFTVTTSPVSLPNVSLQRPITTSALPTL